MSATLANRLLTDAFDRVWEGVRGVVDSLDLDALTYRPNPDANSIAWLVWHLTRVQDDHLAGIAAALHRPVHTQVWHEGDWLARMGLPFDRDAHGYGHTSAEVAAVRVPGDLLVEYADAVHLRSQVVVGQLDELDYAVIVDTHFTPAVTAGVRLISVVNDTSQHLGQAEYVRGLWERG